MKTYDARARADRIEIWSTLFVSAPIHFVSTSNIPVRLLGENFTYNARNHFKEREYTIRIARAGGRIIDIGLWIAASLLTGTYTFWAWTVLDINRFLITKLFYRGEAPVEYAWSIRSKAVRKIWEQSQRARPV